MSIRSDSTKSPLHAASRSDSGVFAFLAASGLSRPEWRTTDIGTPAPNNPAKAASGTRDRRNSGSSTLILASGCERSASKLPTGAAGAAKRLPGGKLFRAPHR